MSNDFHAEVGKLRAWLQTNRWADAYDGWWREGGVVSALDDFLARVAPDDWSKSDVTDLLYVLEQSSTGDTIERVTRTEAMALAIARHSLARGGVASDDIARQMGHCVGAGDEAEALLLAFMRDPHEGTRWMALLSLAELQSAAVPALAVAEWETGDERGRMGALAALKIVGSDLFAPYLSRALEDGRANLLALARRYVEEAEAAGQAVTNRR